MHYRRLQVNHRATQEEIRKAFHSLAVRVHPDKPGGSVELFQALQTSYEILGNEQKRALYDAELKKKGEKLRGFKRPPPLGDLRAPVHYKLADDEYYSFETSADRLKCTFKHGDIIKSNDKMGCFVGLAGDNFLYWREDGNSYASKLCQFGSFGVGNVKVVARANLKNDFGSFSPSYPPRSHVSSAPGTGRSGAATSASGGKQGRTKLSEAERLRREIIRRERENYYRRAFAALAERETNARVLLVEKIEAALEDRRHSFKEWMEEGGARVEENKA